MFKVKKKNKKQQYYKGFDLIRILACIAVLLYHLNILKGGYLAVCTFFVLSGYLSCVSAFKKEKFSIIEYYKKRLLKIYLPLVITTFITVFVVSLCNINWLNLKPETTSVLLGYNNFWQLGANLDYFARHINSPFMHFWYIAILLQFDLVFPFVFIILRKIGERVKAIPCFLTTILAVILGILFYITSLTDIMNAYYNTFTRIFSILFGLSLGFIHSYYQTVSSKKKKDEKFNHYMFYIYSSILVILFVFVDAKSVIFPISMVLVTLLTTRIIDYSINVKFKETKFDKIIKSLASVSYEIYLLQYPVIYFFNYLNINKIIKLILMIILILILAYFIRFTLDKNQKHKKLRYIGLLIILGITCCGGYHYVIAKDHTQEMKELERQLAQNEELIQKKQEEYMANLKKEETAWFDTINDLNNTEVELKNMVNSLSVVGVGDSVMLGAVDNLYRQFPNGYFDAKLSRTAWVVNDILKNLKNNNMLGNPIVLNLGANGDCPESCKEQIIATCGDRQIFWVNTTNDSDVHVNDGLNRLASRYNNLHIIDWNSISKTHQEYFIADGIHLTDAGKKAYVKAIYDAIYQLYLNDYNTKKAEVLAEHKKELKNKISFYGNDLLLNAFDYLQNDFNDAKYTINKDFTYESLKENIINDKEQNILNYKIVLTFDNTFMMSLEDYKSLIELCEGHEVYILSFSEVVNELQYDSVKVINFASDIKENNNYLLPDQIHLTKEGNEAITKILKETVKDEN